MNPNPGPRQLTSYHSRVAALLALVWCSIASLAFSSEPPWTGLTLPAAGQEEQSLRSKFGSRGTVVVFLSTECPISNGYLPTLNRLAEEWKEEGVTVLGINANQSQSLQSMTRHAREFSVGFPVFRDPAGEVALALKATTCPEVILLDADAKTAYRGRIDDRYTGRGRAPRSVGRADLELAVQSLLSGTPIEVTETKVTGCPIDRHADEPPSAIPADEVPTYSRDIAPLLQDHCTECHRPGGIGPFALEDYASARRWADDIASFTASRSMPPWKATPGFGDIDGSRHMPQEAIHTIAAWVQGGTPEGDPQQLPPPREFASRWKLGREPDLLLDCPEYTLGADGPDEYRCFVIPTDLAGDQYVTALEVRPGNARVVHHVLTFLDVNGRARSLDQRHEGPGYITSAGYPGFLPSGNLGGWAPGMQVRELPEGIVRLLPRQADVVVQVHYHRSGRVETDRTQIGLYFSQKPPERCVQNVPVLPWSGPLGEFEIPAGSPRHEVRTSFVLPQEMQAVSITPHMHLLGHDMEVTARHPDGTVINLIQITNWDFNWQETYLFRAPVNLPRLTRIEVVAHFDNSAENPANPFRPVRAVRWGESTDEEMCIAFIEMVPTTRDRRPLKPPTRAERLQFFLQSQWLDDSRPAGEKLKLMQRMGARLKQLDESGGLLPESNRAEPR